MHDGIFDITMITTMTMTMTTTMMMKTTARAKGTGTYVGVSRTARAKSRGTVGCVQEAEEERTLMICRNGCGRRDAVRVLRDRIKLRFNAVVAAPRRGGRVRRDVAVRYNVKYVRIVRS